MIRVYAGHEVCVLLSASETVDSPEVYMNADDRTALIVARRRERCTGLGPEARMSGRGYARHSYIILVMETKDCGHVQN